MSTLADLVRGGRKKQIDEAVDVPPSTQAVAPPPAKEEDALPSGTPADEKWDDYLQQWVPVGKWMSPQEHRKKEEKARQEKEKRGGFADVVK